MNSGLFEKRMTDVNDCSFAAHIKKLCYPNTWATHIEVMAISTYFQAPVYFCTDPPQQSTGGSYCWECYSPLASREALRYPIITDHEAILEEANSPHFELAYYTNCHYNSIVSVHTGALHASPPPLTGKISYHEQIIE